MSRHTLTVTGNAATVDGFLGAVRHFAHELGGTAGAPEFRTLRGGRLRAHVRLDILDLETASLLREAVTTDGAHHKQHFLEQLAVRLGVQLPDHTPGVAP